MDRAQFWKLIGSVDRAALGASDDEGAVQPVLDQLARSSDDEIAGFAEQLAQVLYALDSRAHADASGESADSDDGFLYARCFVVASGEAHYARVLKDPSAMPPSLDEWCEALLYVAPRAWAEKTGRDEDEWDFEASVSYETGSNAANWS